ncbi:MAG: PaaX family transcriptional regulator C-terminal domain-containing protein [Longimicrobiales bacterium]|nr:PaaX family transcriptional regulator C-terminal domain-containing protein [Longimicrobiales bacterium]
MVLARPKDLVFTLFGDYLLHRPGPVWVGSILDLLEPLEVSATSARTTLSRMCAEGWFTTFREGRKSFYELTTHGRRLLEEGEERIHHPRWGDAGDGRWLLVTYSIPEEERSLRDRFRDRLLWLGFGSLGNGLWISPHPVADEVRREAEALGLAGYMEVFRADHLGGSDPATLVSRCWDLERINGRYQEFISRHISGFQELRAAADRGEDGDGITPEDAFVRRFRLIHEYREFPLLDPYLPERLLPEGWAGECASVFFERYYEALAGRANAYVDERVVTPALTPASRADR